MSDQTIIVLGVIAGFFVISVAAQWQPELVNGVLLLILVGTILGNADRWLPLLNQFGSAGSASIARSRATPGGGPKSVASKPR